MLLKMVSAEGIEPSTY